MNTLKNLRNDYVAIEVAYNDLDMIGDTVVLADLCKIEAETLFPNKSRARRRKQTAKKHSRLDKVIEDVYPVEDCNKHNLKKTIKSNKGWYIYDDNRKDNLAGQIADGLAEYEYQAKVDAFYKLVEDFLNQPVYHDDEPVKDEEFFFEPDECFPFEDDKPFEFVDESREAPKTESFDIREMFDDEEIEFLKNLCNSED